VILEMTLAQERADESIAFFNWITDEDIPVVITAFSLYASEIIATARRAYENLEKFLKKMKEINGLTIYHTAIDEEIEIAKLAHTTNLDFDDALQYFVAKKLDATLVSFDSHFDNTDLKRVEPRDVLPAISSQ